MKRILPAFLGILFLGQASHVLADLDTTYTIPIYIQSVNAPSKYWIYASQDGGAAVPYLFDTGSPNMFTFQGVNSSITPTGTFAFGDGNPVYNYYEQAQTISLTNNSGSVIATTATSVNVAKVVSINSGSSPVPTPLGDGTYGDFGAGMYGTSTLATVLAALPIGSNVKTGWIVNVAGQTSGVGSLTVGLTQTQIDAINNSPGAIKMTMNPSGDTLNTVNGPVSGFQKTAVTASLTLTNDDGTLTQDIGTVFDTGGGPNGVVYDTDFLGYGGGSMTLTYEGQVFTAISGTTIWGGSVVVEGNNYGGLRVNPGGFLYQDYTVMFDLSDSSLTLVPFTVPEPSSLCLGLLALGVGAWTLRRPKSWSLDPRKLA